MAIGSILLQVFLVESDPFGKVGLLESLQEGWSIFFGGLDDIVDQEGNEGVGRAQVHLDKILFPKVFA